MKRKGVVIAGVVASVIILSTIYVFIGTKKAENLMWEYLYEKGYTQAQIQIIDVNHSFLNIILSYNEWNITVVYTDEPDSIYSYSMKSSNIFEGGVSGTTAKEDLKH